MQIELQTVRPMLFKTIDIENCGLKLAEHLSDKIVQTKVEKYLKTVVDEMLETELDNLLTGHPDQPTLPQVRLRVGYTNENRTLLPGKFGNNYHEKGKD